MSALLSCGVVRHGAWRILSKITSPHCRATLLRSLRFGRSLTLPVRDFSAAWFSVACRFIEK
jgi:hypothetical protein